MRTESRRLRYQLSCAELQICMTIASFREAKPCSPALEDACKRAASHGIEIIQRLMSSSSNGERAKLEAKLQALQAVLADGPKGSGAADQSAPKPAVTLNGSKPANRGVAVEKLTRRELEVLRHIAEGKSTKQVAAALGITFKTAACHRYRVMDKLGIHETANLVRYAIREGLVQV